MQKYNNAASENSVNKTRLQCLAEASQSRKQIYFEVKNKLRNKIAEIT